MDLIIKKTNSTFLPREAGERQKRCQTEIDKRIRFQGQEQIAIGVLTSKQIPFFIWSFVGRDLGGFRFFRFFFSVFCSVFSVFQFAVPFFPFFPVCSSVFSVSGSVCCSQVPENPFIGYFVEGRGIRVEGSGFLGLRVPGLKV